MERTTKMEEILKALEGKKTFLIAIVTVVLGVLQGLEIFVLPDYAWPIIAAAGFAALRSGVNKIAETMPTEEPHD
jgi:hypothetical protein